MPGHNSATLTATACPSAILRYINMTRLLCHGTDKYEEAGRLLRRLLAEPENKEHVLSVRHALDDLEGIKFFCVQAPSTWRI
mmetsp:Transcript_7032/g.17209  ORF Transcript_7032/g.17209 Transcript_7032/m.17209 type:complete len:82 (-) Transcript_7032:705-950(-)